MRQYSVLILALATALLCMSISPTFANLSQINFSNSPQLISLSPPPPLSPSPTSGLQQGKALYDAGRFAEAVQVLQQAVKQYQQQGDTLSLAVANSNLSLAYQQLGAWTEAKQAIANSLNLQGISQEERGRGGEGARGRLLIQNPKSKIQNLEVLGQTLDIQGRLQLAMGQPEDALATWQAATDIYTKANDKSGVVRSHINQAQALRTQGFYRRAVDTLLAVNQTLQSQPDSLEKAVGLRSLGDALQLMGDLQQSRVALQQSLSVAQHLQSPSDIAASLFSLGNNARTQQQKQQAIAFYQQTVKVSPSPLTKLQAQLNLLSLLIEDKQLIQAQTLISKIPTELQQLPPSRSAIYARINFAQSLMKVRNEELGVKNSKNEAKKTKLRKRSKELLTPNSSLLTLTSQLLATAIQQSRDLGDKRTEAYALGSLGSLYEQTGQLTEAQKLTQQALILAQATNAPDIIYPWQWQLGRLLKKQNDIKGAIALYDAAVDTLQSLRSDLVKVNQDIQFSFRDSVEPVYRESVELLLQSQQGTPNAKTLDKARQRIEALQLAELDNFFREACLQGERVAIDKIVDRDNPSAAILYPIILPQQLQVIVKIPKQPLGYYSTNIPQAEVEKIAAQLRLNLVQPAAKNAVKEDAQQVYNWLIKPIEAELAKSGVNTIVFVLDGALRNLPMSALYDGQQYLVEKYAVALSVGLQLTAPKSLGQEKLRALTAGLTQPPPEYSNFPPLPAIKSEFNLITEAGVSTTSLLDRQFTKKALENKVNASPYNVIHLATHGQFSSRREDTFILAADGPINVVQFDTLFSNRDETRPEAVQLLVLSACQTAAGDNRAALGLAGAAVRAGARSTLASLWQIDDESTALFVGAFYRELKGGNVTKAQALRGAQLQLLQHPNYNSPSFWSAYVLIGNWL
ncbi:MAG: CHAT domain-containing protein [Heteroscytonema crispum UTEX LB 1556]